MPAKLWSFHKAWNDDSKLKLCHFKGASKVAVKERIYLMSLLRLGTLLSVAVLTLTGCVAQETSEPAPATTRVTAAPETQVEEPAQEPEEVVEQAPLASSEPQVTFQEQEVDFSITGGCLDSYDAVGYYGIFEEFSDDCYLVVEIFPAKPARYVSLQYFDSTWVTEDSQYTDSTGVIYLEVDPYCDDGYWCEGVWEYRVLVDEAEGNRAERSPTFELDFISYY